jgi:hypothetical protein
MSSSSSSSYRARYLVPTVCWIAEQREKISSYSDLMERVSAIEHAEKLASGRYMRWEERIVRLEEQRVDYSDESTKVYRGTTGRAKSEVDIRPECLAKVIDQIKEAGAVQTALTVFLNDLMDELCDLTFDAEDYYSDLSDSDSE